MPGYKQRRQDKGFVSIGCQKFSLQVQAGRKDTLPGGTAGQLWRNRLGLLHRSQVGSRYRIQALGRAEAAHPDNGTERGKLHQTRSPLWNHPEGNEERDLTREAKAVLSRVQK